MRNYYDPNEPNEVDLTLEVVLESLTTEYAEVIEDEIEVSRLDAEHTRSRIKTIKNEISLLIEIYKQTEQTLIVNKLTKLLEL